jgi:hypothetical protein
MTGGMGFGGQVGKYMHIILFFVVVGILKMV